MSDDGVIDLSDAPRHTGFGEDNPADTTSGDFEASVHDAASKTPTVAIYNSIDQTSENGAQLVNSLFDGRATVDQLLAFAQDISGLLTLTVEMVDLFDSNTPIPSPGYWSGILAKAGLDFLLALFQPLEDMIGIFTGNPERLEVSGQMWGAGADGLLDMAEHLGKLTIEDMLPHWSGGASASATLRLSEFQQAIHSIAIVCDLVRGLMDRLSGVTAALMNQANQIMADMVGDAVSVAAMLLSPVFFPDAVGTLAMKIAKAVAFLVDLAIRMVHAYWALAQTLMALQAVFEQTTQFLTRMAAPPR